MDETIKDIAADLRARAARAEAAAGFPTVEAENDRRLAGRIEAAAEREHSRDASGKAGDIADILRDMRAREMELWEGKPPRLGAGAAALMLDAFIDRLEAAAERERNRQYEPKCDWSIKDALALANTLANHGLRDGNADAASSCIYSLCRIRSSPGNAAATREALKAIDENTDLLDIAEDIGPNLHPSHSFVAVQIRRIARAALAAPARNCDILSEEEADEAWDEYRHSHVLPRGGWDFRHVIAWLLAKAEGGAK